MLSKIIILFTILVPTFTEHERIITSLKYSRFRVKPVIVNGAIARSGQLPYLVSIKEPIFKISSNKTLWSNLCGGSIIGKAKVLSAAHCFESNNFYYSKHPGGLRVVAGSLKSELKHSGHIQTSDQGQWRKIIHVTVHDDFNFPTNDIALVFTNIPWNYTGTVDYILPARRNIDYANTCFAAGFGQTGQSASATISKVLLWAEIGVFTRTQCNVLWEMNMDTFICTNSIATDVGGGDSGGPLACVGTLDPTEVPNRDLLVGIVSGKNYDRSTLFTRVSKYKDWLVENKGSSLKGNLFGLCFVIKIVCMRFCCLSFIES